MDKIFDLVIDTKLKTYQRVLGIKQFENNVVLNITLVQNSLPLDLTNCMVRLNYLNKNELLLQPANIVSPKEGMVRVKVLTKVLDTIGDTPVDISVFDEQNRKITTSTFVLVVGESIYNNDKIDIEELDLIQGIYAKEDERQKNEKIRISNEEQREINERTRVQNEENTKNNELTRESNEKIRISNEKVRESSEKERVSQEVVRQENEGVRVSSESERINSMKEIKNEWDLIKEDLSNLGGGDMLKSTYDTNRNGIVDLSEKSQDTEKFNGKTIDNFLKKGDNITWNTFGSNITSGGTTTKLSLIKDNPNDTLKIDNINGNWDKIDTAFEKLEELELKTLESVRLNDITETGIYLVKNLINAPDKPPIGSNLYLVEVIQIPNVSSTSDASRDKRFRYRLSSMFTGKEWEIYTLNKRTVAVHTIAIATSLPNDELHINPTDGDDNNDGFSKEKSIKSWEVLMARMPAILTNPLTIYLHGQGFNDINLHDIHYMGGELRDEPALTITGSEDVLVGDVNLTNIHTPSSTYGIELNNVNSVSGIVITESSSTMCDHCVSSLIVSNNTPVACNECNTGYQANMGAEIIVENHINADESSLPTYGCVATGLSTIFVKGTRPSGSSGSHKESMGGKVIFES